MALLLGWIVPAAATPIRPDIRKLVADPADSNLGFAPARAGWNGPEASTDSIGTVNPAVERLTPAASARAVRASLIASLIPDWRMLATVGMAILGLRLLRRGATPARVAPSNEVVDENGLNKAA